MQDVGVAGIAALVGLAASLLAAGLIWLLTTQPETLATLTRADSVWGVMAGLAARLLAII